MGFVGVSKHNLLVWHSQYFITYVHMLNTGCLWVSFDSINIGYHWSVHPDKVVLRALCLLRKQLNLLFAS